MRLARFAVAGLTLGLAAGFVVALLRPRSRHEVTISSGRSLTESTGQPVSWGSRSPGGSARSTSSGAAARLAAPFAPDGTGPGSVAR